MHLDYLELLEFMSGPKKDDDAMFTYCSLWNQSHFSQEKVLKHFSQEKVLKQESGRTIHNFSNKEIPGTHSVHC